MRARCIYITCDCDMRTIKLLSCPQLMEMKNCGQNILSYICISKVFLLRWNENIPYQQKTTLAQNYNCYENLTRYVKRFYYSLPLIHHLRFICPQGVNKLNMSQHIFRTPKIISTLCENWHVLHHIYLVEKGHAFCV